MPDYCSIRIRAFQSYQKSSYRMLLLHCPSICRLSILSYATFVAYPYGVYIVSVNVCTYLLYLSGFVQSAICTDVEVIADASKSARSVISSQIFNGVVAIYPCCATMQHYESYFSSVVIHCYRSWYYG